MAANSKSSRPKKNPEKGALPAGKNKSKNADLNQAVSTVSADLVKRMPPQNLDAEQAVLGGVFLSNEVLHTLIDTLSEEDFYSPAHKIIFRAFVELYRRNIPVDLVTIHEELEKNSLLESVGGAVYLASLTEAVAASANVHYYAQIVKEKAVRRHLIRAAANIIAQSFDPASEVSDLLDSSEQSIFAVSESKSRQVFRSSRELVDDVFELLEKRVERKELVTGVPTGFHKLDEITAGFQPTDLIICAGRPSMGKTAFALNVAMRSAVSQEIKTAIFSLEMSMEQLMMRMLCAWGKVDLKNLRTGFLNDEDWARLYQSAEVLSKAPIYIDDTPALSSMDMRARSRRLKAEKGLDMVVVDYLQLMRAGRFIDSREQEISEISRSLKALAKELNVPVVALSQLNRKVEDRTNKRPVLSDLRECVTGDTLVCLADGSRIPISELVGTTPKVIAMNRHGILVNARSDLVWPVGQRNILEVKLASGRILRVTADHRLYSAGGWCRVATLKQGDRLAIARQLPEPENNLVWPDGRVALLAHLIGDGSYLKGQPLRYTTADESSSQLVEEAATQEFNVRVNRHYPQKGAWHQLVFSGNGNRWRPAGLNLWLRELGIFNQRSYEKRIPREVFRLGNRQIFLFLQHLWATDGTVYSRREGMRGSHAIHFSTNSPGLATDVSALLLRCGIISRTQTVHQAGSRPWQMVHVSGSIQQRLFLEKIGGFGPRRCEQVQKLAAELATTRPNPNVDTLPRQLFNHVRAAMSDQGITHRQMAVMRGTAYGGNSHFRFAPSRRILNEYAEILDDDLLRAHCKNDLFWDTVVAVEPAGQEEVYDLTVPEHASWLADGIISHNSGAIEQDADVILFLYRDGVYNPKEDNPRRNTAEVIIGKQRNGPVGTVELSYLDRFTAFENLTYIPAPSEEENVQ